MGNKGDFLLSQYTGSKRLSFLCAITSMSIDQVNFIACQIFALLLSFSLRRWVKDPFQKLVYCLVSGIGICYFCFGNQIFHVITSAGISYLAIRTNKSRHMPWLVFLLSMGYLSWLHLKRQFFEFGKGYSLDITGPLMVLTQKLTALAFSVGDGQKQRKSDDDCSKSELTELQKGHAVSQAPGFLEFWSFIFQFQSMLAGPLVFFGDFREFILTNDSPNPVGVVLRKLSASILFAFLFIKVAPHFEIELLRDTDFLKSTSVLYKLYYITLATTLERTKYYHAWILSDAVCNASGLGYNKANKSWDLVTNVDTFAFEFGLNMKESLDQWNKGTMKWLRYVIYERFNPQIRTWVTYGASAIWHGYFPGYYITFLSGALFTSVARIVRKTVRPLFLDNQMAKRFYDFVTWLTTRLIISYVSFTFVLLDFVPSIIVYARLYFFFHIAAIGAMVVLPQMSKTMSPQDNEISKRNRLEKRTVLDKAKQRQIINRSVNTPEDLKSLSFEILSRNGSTLKLKTG